MSIIPNGGRLKAHFYNLVAIATVFCTLAFAAARADQATPSVPPAKALQLLLDGNQRYATDHAGHPNQRPSDSPQHPLAVILSCSDSRVPPEIIFDHGDGNLFIVRVAGNTYDR